MAKVLAGVLGIVFGIGLGYLLTVTPAGQVTLANPINLLLPSKKIIGFLPYWLLSSARTDYSLEVTQLDYFALTVGADGHLIKVQNQVETEPGWYTLSSGKVQPWLDAAENKKITLGLVVFNGDQENIDRLMDDPIAHADNLLADVLPIMTRYHFQDLNLDIESSEDASVAGQLKFKQFTDEIRQHWSGTLSADMVPTAFVKLNLINPQSMANDLDKVIVMSYDYHNPNSHVTGPVSPIGGADGVAEFDAQTALKEAKRYYSSDKLIWGVPLYGYSWETLNNFPRAATIPSTGLTVSAQTVAKLLTTCQCQVQYDNVGQEAFLIYQDPDTHTYHQVFYPNSQALQAKINFASQNHLGGLALWALGYEDSNLLNPLAAYRAE